MALMGAVAFAQTSSDPSSSSGGSSGSSSSSSGGSSGSSGSSGSQSSGQKMKTVEMSKLMKANVKTAQGENLGKIEDLVANPQTGEIQFAIIGMGGTAGIGEQLKPVPWKAITVALRRIALQILTGRNWNPDRHCKKAKCRICRILIMSRASIPSTGCSRLLRAPQVEPAARAVREREVAVLPARPAVPQVVPAQAPVSLAVRVPAAVRRPNNKRECAKGWVEQYCFTSPLPNNWRLIHARNSPAGHLLKLNHSRFMLATKSISSRDELSRCKGR